MKKLTGFIKDWSEPQLAWQNWFEEDYVDMVLWMDAQCEELQL